MKVRKILGASIFTIMRLISIEFLMLVLGASLIAFPVAWWLMSRWLQNFAYRITLPWWIFLASGTIVLLIAWSTVSIQAIRAATVNPIKSIRSQVTGKSTIISPI